MVKAETIIYPPIGKHGGDFEYMKRKHASDSLFLEDMLIDP